MTPQMMDAVPNTCVDGHQNVFWSLRSHMSGMLVNIHACTPSCVVPAMTVAMIWHMNIVRGGIFM
jgi:hypothetical protein